MKTLKEVGYSIRNAVKGYFSSDDERIDIEYVYDKVWDVYAKLKEKYKKENGYLDPVHFSQKCCLDVKCRKLVCDGIESEELEYYVELPALDSSGGQSPIRYFGSDGLKDAYYERSIDGFQYAQYDTYISRVPTFTRIGNIAILRNLPTSSLSKACLVAVLDDPGSKCSPDDKFPGPRNFLFELELLVKKDIMSTLNIPPDLTNNANDLTRMPQQEQVQAPQRQQQEEEQQ